MLTDAQVRILLSAKDRVLHSALLFGLLTGYALRGDLRAHGGGHHSQGQPWAVYQHQGPTLCGLLKSKAAEREVPLHRILEQLLDTTLPTSGRLFPHLTWIAVVKRYAYLRRLYPELQRHACSTPPASGSSPSVSAQASPEHFTASLVGHHSARSANKLTYGLYSAGISDAQKREIVDGVRLQEQ